ncbi:hypothetical protein CsSME_00001121 [Camellia sinensis var. sinensis]
MVWKRMKMNQEEAEDPQQHEYPCYAKASIEGINTFYVLDVVCFVSMPFLETRLPGLQFRHKIDPKISPNKGDMPV